jgi:hypothetical protein
MKLVDTERPMRNGYGHNHTNGHLHLNGMTFPPDALN